MKLLVAFIEEDAIIQPGNCCCAFVTVTIHERDI